MNRTTRTPRARWWVVCALGSLLCIPDLGRAQTFSETLACQKALRLYGKAHEKKRLAYVLSCVDRLLKCELLSENDALDVTSCRNASKDRCKTYIGSQPDARLRVSENKFDTSVEGRCLALGTGPMLSTAPGGLEFANDPVCGSLTDLSDLVECIRGRLDEQADAIASIAKPRAGLLLDNAGFGQDFPNLVRPPMDDVTVSASAAGSGVLVNPGGGTINLTAAGYALRITGDPATLPCGGGQGGRLTITVGSQKLELREPYSDPEDVAIFGPFTTSGSVPYEIELRDGSCQEPSVTGNVVVP